METKTGLVPFGNPSLRGPPPIHHLNTHSQNDQNTPHRRALHQPPSDDDTCTWPVTARASVGTTKDDVGARAGETDDMTKVRWKGERKERQHPRKSRGFLPPPTCNCRTLTLSKLSAPSHHNHTFSSHSHTWRVPFTLSSIQLFAWWDPRRWWARVYSCGSGLVQRSVLAIWEKWRSLWKMHISQQKKKGRCISCKREIVIKWQLNR